MDCRLPGSSIRGIFQARVLEWVAITFFKVGLKQHSKAKIMASGPITSSQVDGETMETVTDFIFLGFKITADGVCSHEYKDTYSLEENL